MEVDYTLSSMFESNKKELENKLKDLVLPKDASKVQRIVMGALNTMFENDGEYRQGLTQSEYYILIAAIELLNAQQNIVREIVAGMEGGTYVSLNKANNQCRQKEKNSYLWMGTVTGAVVGTMSGIFLDTWKAVFCAIAGSAVVIYGVTSLHKTKSTEKESVSCPIDTQVFVNIVKTVCEKIDGLIETYRVQVTRVKNMYKQREKPSLQRDYPLLLQAIQALVAIEQNTGEPDKRMKKVEKKIADLSETLENYGLSVVDGKITEIVTL